MTKKLVRVFDVFIILAVLISQLGLVSGTALDANAAPMREKVHIDSSFAGLTLSNVRINGGGDVAYIAPSSVFSLSMDYSIVDPGCPGCKDEKAAGRCTRKGCTTTVVTDRCLHHALF